MRYPAVYAIGMPALSFLSTLDQECSSYCLIGRYEGLPATIGSDIDFMVSGEDFARIPHILRSLARHLGFRLTQQLQHETTASYYVLACSRPGEVRYLHPDPCSDYRAHERVWFRPDTVLAHRRKHKDGFWVPAAADAFIYYLIKRILKQDLCADHTSFLTRLYCEDPDGCMQRVTERLPPASARLVAEAGNSGDWKPVVQVVPQLSKEFLRSAFRYSLRERLLELMRRLRRLAQPTGLYVALLGPDGVGKSSVITHYIPALEPAFRRSEYFQLRPHLFRGSDEGRRESSQPHSLAARGMLKSVAKLLFLWTDYFFGYLFRVRPLLVRSTLVVFDRHYLDLLVDMRRFRYGGPAWLVRLIGAFIPEPDLILVLDAPAAVLQARKHEVSFEESARQAEAYRTVLSSALARGRAVLIDATLPLDQVVHECTDRTLAFLERRTASRLHLD
jgi:thymidylate kinase